MDVRKRNEKKYLKNDHEMPEKIISCSCHLSSPPWPCPSGNPLSHFLTEE